MEVPASQSVNRVPSAVFSEEERVFTRMLDERGVLVGDRWFPAHSPELERARYLVSSRITAGSSETAAAVSAVVRTRARRSRGTSAVA